MGASPVATNSPIVGGGAVIAPTMPAGGDLAALALTANSLLTSATQLLGGLGSSMSGGVAPGVLGGGPAASAAALPQWLATAYPAGLPVGTVIDLGPAPQAAAGYGNLGSVIGGGSALGGSGFVTIGGGDTSWAYPSATIAGAGAFAAPQAAASMPVFGAQPGWGSGGQPSVVQPSAGVYTPPASAANSQPSTASTSERARNGSVSARPGSQRGGFTPQSVHMTQFRNSRFNPDGPARSGNCGIVSMVMALRLAGLDVPGFSGELTDDAIDKARRIATGANNISDGTNVSQWKKLADAAGAKTRTTKDLDTALGWVRNGAPIVLSGNMAKAWGKRYGNDKIAHFDGNHAVTVSGYDAGSGKYLVNDPLSRIGVISVPAAELRAYAASSGTALAVSR